MDATSPRSGAASAGGGGGGGAAGGGTSRLPVDFNLDNPCCAGAKVGCCGG